MSEQLQPRTVALEQVAAGMIAEVVEGDRVLEQAEQDAAAEQTQEAPDGETA